VPQKHQHCIIFILNLPKHRLVLKLHCTQINNNLNIENIILYITKIKIKILFSFSVLNSILLINILF